jgi:CBS domain-containing protein
MDESIGETPITSVMHTSFPSVHPDTPIAEIYRSFTQQACRDIIVCDEVNRFLGMITRLDMLSAITPGIGIRSRKKRGCLECLVKSAAKHAGDIMSRSHITIPNTATIADALIAMEKNRHPDIIVVDEKGTALGIVEMCNIIAYLVEKQFI